MHAETFTESWGQADELTHRVAARFSAEHYALVKDKPWILTAAKRSWGSRVGTVLVCPGHDALDPRVLSDCPAADIRLDSIGELLQYNVAAMPEAG